MGFGVGRITYLISDCVNFIGPFCSVKKKIKG